MNFDIYTGAGALSQTIKCTTVTATQFKGCVRSAGNLVAVTLGTSTIRGTNNTAANGSVTNVIIPLPNDAYAGAGPHDYTVASTMPIAANTFWMQATDQTWSVVTCNGLGNSAATAGGAVNQFQLCSGVPASTAGNSTISTGALVGKDVGNIGGYLKVEIQKADGSGWQDVTAEILNYGFADVNQAGATATIDAERDHQAGAL